MSETAVKQSPRNRNSPKMNSSKLSKSKSKTLDNLDIIGVLPVTEQRLKEKKLITKINTADIKQGMLMTPAPAMLKGVATAVAVRES